MTYRKHPRRMTDEQFADGTTIDGSRLDKAMEEVTEHFNDMGKADMGRRFVQTQYVAGWQPASDKASQQIDCHHMPWLPVINWPTGAAGTWPGSVVGSVPDEIKNKHRFKGIATSGIHLDVENFAVVGVTTEDLKGMQWAWTRKMAFSKPVIVQDVSIHLHVDNPAGDAIRPYQNDFHFDGAYVPDGYVNASETRDLRIALDVDHPFTPEDARMKSVALLKTDFSVAFDGFSRLALGKDRTVGATYQDMLPIFQPQSGQFDCETVGGVLVRASDINIPLPARSRVRLAVVIPQYDVGSIRSGWGDVPGSGLQENPWAAQSYTATLTVLEEIESV
jgi:hypothetical protein